jgi:hypothetical protein
LPIQQFEAKPVLLVQLVTSLPSSNSAAAECAIAPGLHLQTLPDAGIAFLLFAFSLFSVSQIRLISTARSLLTSRFPQTHWRQLFSYRAGLKVIAMKRKQEANEFKNTL